MTNATNVPARTVTITLSDLGNADLMALYHLLDRLEDTDGTTEIWLHVGETAEERLQPGTDRVQRGWIKEIKEAYDDCFSEGEPTEEPTAEEGPGDFLADIVRDWRARPENAELDALLEANAIDVRDNPQNLYRAGVFEGLAAALHATISWASDDYNEVQAAIYEAYGVAW